MAHAERSTIETDKYITIQCNTTQHIGSGWSLARDDLESRWN